MLKHKNGIVKNKLLSHVVLF